MRQAFHVLLLIAQRTVFQKNAIRLLKKTVSKKVKRKFSAK